MKINFQLEEEHVGDDVPRQFIAIMSSQTERCLFMNENRQKNFFNGVSTSEAHEKSSHGNANFLHCSTSQTYSNSFVLGTIQLKEKE
jgi:ABC-type siderophore export system fused ATPase/permease subunit